MSWREQQIRPAAAQRLRELLDEMDQIIDQEIRHAENQSAAAGRVETVFAALPEGLRWKLMALSCSISDYNLWLREDPDDSRRWLCTEVETGFTAAADTRREAILKCMGEKEQVVHLTDDSDHDPS